MKREREEGRSPRAESQREGRGAERRE